jgi:hypothetical protein
LVSWDSEALRIPATAYAQTLEATFFGQMIRFLNRFWDSFGEKDFGLKIVAPTLGLFFTLGSCAQYYSFSLDKDELVKTSGTVEWITETEERGTTLTKYYPLMISLQGHQEQFRVKDNFKYRFKDLKNRIRNGDNLTVYTRTKAQTIVGWGQRFDIFQIEKESEILFDIKWMKNYNKNQMEFFGFFSLIAWGLFVAYIYKRRSEKGSRQQRL